MLLTTLEHREVENLRRLLWAPDLLVSLMRRLANLLFRLAWVGILSASAASGAQPLSQGDVATSIQRNAGIFMGVNRYTTNPKLGNLDFAVNDAIAQAEVFALRLRLILPRNAVVLLSGAPTGRYLKTLEELEKSGVQVVHTATRSDFFDAFQALESVATTPESLAIVSFSSHGCEFDGKPYLCPQDAVASEPETFISLLTVERKLDALPARKRLLLVDACRSPMPIGKATGLVTPVSKAFYSALTEARGRLLLSSCDVGQVSLEDPTLQHGVFTFALLEAFHGKADDGASEFMRMDQVFRYVRAVAPVLARDVRRKLRTPIAEEQIQTACIKGRFEAFDMPLAISGAFLESRERRFKCKEAIALARIRYPKILPGETAQSIESAIDGWQGASLDALLRSVDRFVRRPLADGSAPSDNYQTDLEVFVGWWKQQSAKVAQPASEKPISRSPLADQNAGEAGRVSEANDPRLVIVGAMEGLPQAQSAAATSEIESILSHCLDIEVRSITLPQVNQAFLTSTGAAAGLDQNNAQVLILSEVSALTPPSTPTFVGLKEEFETQVFAVTLKVSIIHRPARNGKPSVHSRLFSGSYTHIPSNRANFMSDAAGNLEAIRDAIRNFGTNASFLKLAGLTSSVNHNH